jgi:hypothetical protein
MVRDATPAAWCRRVDDIACAPVNRLAAPTVVLLLALAGPAAAAGPPILPLDQVRAGTACSALSVVKGTAISRFGATVEDIVRAEPPNTTARILVRTSGTAVDGTGVGQGFSGSPILCPGPDGVERIIGAISAGVGQYGGDLVLATPIEAIIGQPVDPPSAARGGAGGSRILRAARPLRAPLSVGGLSGGVAGAVERLARRANVPLLAVPSGPQAPFPPAPLVPGAAMAVGLASGDVTAGAVGTVSYVDGDRVWAFGHPFDATGRRSLLLQDAYVYAVVNNPLGTLEASTYKLAVAGHDVGTLTSDGLSAVAGRIGPLPPRIPMRVFARDLDTGELQRLDVQLADETDVGDPSGASALSAIVPLAVAQAATAALDGAPAKQSASMCVRFRVRERPRGPLRFCNTYVGVGGLDGVSGVGLVNDLTEATALIDAYDATPLHVTDVEVNAKLQRGLRQAYLEKVSGPRVLRRGRTARLTLSLRRPRGPAFQRRLALRVPRDAPRGARELRLRGTPADSAASAVLGDLVESLIGDDPEAGEATSDPGSLDELAEEIEDLERYDGVTATLRAPGSSSAASGSEGDGDGQPAGRRVLRDPLLRISGTATLDVTVR